MTELTEIKIDPIIGGCELKILWSDGRFHIQKLETLEPMEIRNALLSAASQIIHDLAKGWGNEGVKDVDKREHTGAYPRHPESH